MRYAPGHKEKTHRKLLLAAGKLFRKSGFKGVSVERVMKQAGLTHGGFYAHFKSKTQLIAETFAVDAGLLRMLREKETASGAARVLSGYMAPENRSEVAAGCPLAALPADVSRSNATIKAAYTARVAELLSLLADRMPAQLDNVERETRAMETMVLALGSVMFSQALSDKELADRLQNVCRHAVDRRFEV